MFHTRVLAVGVAAGLLFAILDGLINANPLAQRLYAVYQPIARESVNAALGLAFDIVSGIVMAMLFVRLKPALRWAPLMNGLAFGLMAWFFRVAMGVAAQAVMFNVPAAALVYTLAGGFVEMCILGAVYGVTLGRTSGAEVNSVPSA